MNQHRSNVIIATYDEQKVIQKLGLLIKKYKK